MPTIKERNKALKAEKITKIVPIICELSDSLDLEIGGEVADNLQNLYNFLILELLAADVHDDLKRIAAVVEMLSEPKDACQEAINLSSGGKVKLKRTLDRTSEPPVD